MSVCLITYNISKYVIEALHSVVQQDYDSFEIVVHDDCSTDDTCRVVTDYLEELKSTTARRIAVYRSHTNCGVFVNRLRAAYRANGEWLIAADADDLSVDGRFSVIANTLEQLDHIPKLLVTNRYVFTDDTPASQLTDPTTVPTNLKEGWVTLTDITDQPLPVGTGGFVMHRSMFG